MEKIIALTVIICMIPDSASTVQVNEGEDALFEFQSNDPDINISLRFEGHAAFYQFGSSEGMNQDQKNRYTIKVEGTAPKIFKLHIRNTNRLDANTIVCQFYKDAVIERTERTTLSVNYPAGIVTCIHTPNDGGLGFYDPWTILKCIAERGTISSYIVCYQNGMISPPFDKEPPLNSSDSHFSQTIWIKKTAPASCCSSTYEHPFDMSRCNHYLWEPEEPEVPHHTPMFITSTYTAGSTITPDVNVDPDPLQYPEGGDGNKSRQTALNVLTGTITFMTIVLTVFAFGLFQILWKLTMIAKDITDNMNTLQIIVCENRSLTSNTYRDDATG
ncbi:uncharacterized protein LOC135153978 [Lytechinus pictus]|uniref:uncharacterized protein LOC135153978 n=1 Tax=Lytechinus pictus TaxID=7653 RepID=UPI0030B9D8D3